MIRLVLAALAFRAFATNFIYGDSPTLTIKQGTLTGTVTNTLNGRKFYSFQGIPYAAPPIGNLRFKAPQAAPHWEGVRSAKREGSDCPQMHTVFYIFTGQEDCLYLNVYTPKLHGKALSVMVWIHGGGYHSGSGSSEFYGPSQLLDQDIVLVTINYRLGALGFLSLGTRDVPGNYGLKDQVAALKWVKENIERFGGNPNSVTLFGESAGAACVEFLMLSPLAKGLFHRAIAQSGSVFNPWATGRDSVELALRMASALRCDQDIIKCFQKASPRDLAELDLSIRKERYWKRYFEPTVEPAGTEGAFLTLDPRSMMALGQISNIPLMAGYTTHEGILEFQYLGNRTMSGGVSDTVVRYLDMLPRLKRNSQDWVHAWRNVNKFYYNLAEGDATEQFILLNSDVDFVLGVDGLVREVAALRRSPVFYYQFSYEGSLGTEKIITGTMFRKGTAHTDELGYLFPKLMLPPSIVASRADRSTIDHITTLWANFAKTGNPTPDDSLGVKWEPIKCPENQPKLANTRYLDIGTKLNMRYKNLNINRVKMFWKFEEQFGNSRMFWRTHGMMANRRGRGTMLRLNKYRGVEMYRNLILDPPP